MNRDVVDSECHRRADAAAYPSSLSTGLTSRRSPRARLIGGRRTVLRCVRFG